MKGKVHALSAEWIADLLQEANKYVGEGSSM